jgi:peptidoglycan hydrolase-like protein with peptidoglycan-binding domain
MKTTKELIDFCESKLGTNYVYGSKGEVLTDAKLEQLKRMYPSYIKDEKSKIGTWCTDCSGLISWCTGIVRGSSQYKESATKVLTIDKISQAVAGCFLWRSGHIGVYIGNGKCIEARGSAYGVVKTNVSDRTFTHILWGKDIDYSNTNVTNNNDNKVNEWSSRPLLMNGSNSAVVMKLQAHLNAINFTVGNAGIDGKFGKGTESAVKQYQKYKGLSQDGKVGSRTWSALEDSLPHLIKRGDKGLPVSALQKILILRGFSCGATGADGQFGKNTFEAVKKFQKTFNLNQDGICGSNTWKSILS